MIWYSPSSMPRHQLNHISYSTKCPIIGKVGKQFTIAIQILALPYTTSALITRKNTLCTTQLMYSLGNYMAQKG